MSEDGDITDPYWLDLSVDDYRALAEAMDRYGAARTLGELRDIWAVRGATLNDPDCGPVEAAVQAELVGPVVEDVPWLVPVAVRLASLLDKPTWRPFWTSAAAEIVKILVSVRDGDDPGDKPRLRLVGAISRLLHIRGVACYSGFSSGKVTFGSSGSLASSSSPTWA